MKRAVVQLSDVSSGFRNTLHRRASTSARGAIPFKGSKQPSHAGSKGPRIQQDESVVAPELRKLLSPDACAWLNGKPYDRKGKQPLTAIPESRFSTPPTLEKMAFDAMDTTAEDASDSFVGSGDDDVGGIETQHIPAGTLVEVRRTSSAVHGVVLFSVLYRRSWTVHTLMDTGEIWMHHEHDVTFQVPDYVPKTLVDECGIFEDAQTESQAAARVDVLKRIRTFDKRFEYDYHRIPELARAAGLYDRVAHPDGKTWVQITTRQVAEMLLGKKATLTTDELFVVQTYLFDQGDLFVSVARRFLQTQTFWVRPRQEVEDIRMVSEMIVQESPALDAFLSKAHAVVLDSRQRALDSYDEPPSRQPLDGVQWTTEDKVIMRCLVASMQNRRVIQADPYKIPLAYMLKKIGLYDTDEYEVRTAHKFLIELGLIAPWEDLNIREDLKRDSPLTIDLVPSKSSPIIPAPLGPNDLYAHDMTESIRHDFGDLPVYVVDDWTAEELDDGISIERIPSDPEHTWIHVHIADPTALLPPTHEIARQAMKMTTAYYFVDRTVPMLPRSANFHNFSLGNSPGQPEVALTFSLKANSSGDIVDYKIRPSVVRNVRIIRYDEVDSLLGTERLPVYYPFGKPASTPTPTIRTFDDSTTDDFRLLKQVARGLTQHRLDNGALVFTFRAPEMIVDPRPLSAELMSAAGPHAFRGFPSVTYTVQETLAGGSRAMIAECMMAAGRVASLFFRDRGIPALRRTVGALQVERKGGLDALMATRSETGAVDPFEAMRMRVSAAAGRYTTVPEGHALLGIRHGEGYVKVTSPLRRFGDMLAHWQIKHALLAERGMSPVLFDADWLAQVGEDMGSRELEAKRTEGRQQQFWAHSYLMRWMQDPGREGREHDPLRSLKARVVTNPVPSARHQGYVCKLNVLELGLQGRVLQWPQDRIHAELGDEVEVEIERIQLGSHPLLDLRVRS